jgi:hypothetical protein
MPKRDADLLLTKRAIVIILALFLVVVVSFAIGMYNRQKQFARSASALDASKKVEPATRAGEEITKDIPPGPVNLTKADKFAMQDPPRLQPTPTDNHQNQGPAHSGYVMQEPSGAMLSSTPPDRPSFQSTPTFSAADERLVQAYERELQALAAPTSTQSDTGLNQFAADVSANTPAVDNDAAPLSTLI